MGETTVTRIEARGVVAPMRRPLVTGGGKVMEAPFALVDLHASDGSVGRAYVFAYGAFALGALVAAIEGLGETLVDHPLAPRTLFARMRARLRFVGPVGAMGQALSGLDMAAWDAFAKGRGEPLCAALGAEATPTRAYNSNGLGLIGPEAIGPEARALAEGFGAVKLRLGYPTLAEDLAAIRACREAVGPDLIVMSDYNQSLLPAEAARRARAIAGQVHWIEEPVRADDVAGHAQVRAAASTQIMTGENAFGPPDIARLIDGGAADLLMPDVGKVWGVSGWLEAAALCDAAAIPVSSHLYPEISVHLLAATPTADWLEYVDWAEPLLAEPLRLDAGVATPPGRPGAGIEWDEAAVKRYQR